MTRLFFTILLACCITNADAAHPGISGKDAPGGRIVRIDSGDIEIYTVLYEPENVSGKIPALVFVHGFKPYSWRAGEWDTYWAKEIASTKDMPCL